MIKAFMITMVAALPMAFVNGVIAGNETDMLKSASATLTKKSESSTSDLKSQLAAKEQELRNEFAYEGIDMNRVSELEDEIREIKKKMKP